MRILITLLFTMTCATAFAEDSVFAKEKREPLVTRILLEANKTTAGYVISGTMFHEIIATLQASQAVLRAKDEDVARLQAQVSQANQIVEREKQAKDLLVTDRVSQVLADQELVLVTPLTHEEKQQIEDSIKRVIAQKAVPVSPAPTATSTPVIVLPKATPTPTPTQAPIKKGL